MPNHIKLRIAFLRERITEGLHQENLDKLVAECSTLSQDTAYFLAFFVLKNVFAEISKVIDREAVAVERHRELTSGIAEGSILVLDKIERGERVEAGDLELILGNHVRNVSIFRAEQ